MRTSYEYIPGSICFLAWPFFVRFACVPRVIVLFSFLFRSRTIGADLVTRGLDCCATNFDR